MLTLKWLSGLLRPLRLLLERFPPCLLPAQPHWDARSHSPKITLGNAGMTTGTVRRARRHFTHSCSASFKLFACPAAAASRMGLLMIAAAMYLQKKHAAHVTS